ncbi:MAG: glycosyltransferase family 2 protein [Clostridiales bacterium]|nr:glycosyltransferase family 2 protein [Clostridiales bacterium]
MRSDVKTALKKLLAKNAVTERWGRRINSFLKGNRYCLWKKTPEKAAAILCPPEEFARQRNTKFAQDICVSIVVPLYNTPVGFLKEMIASVRLQSYENWELVLADGSDDKHSEVQSVCEKLMQEDGRIRYKKLPENLGISGNTNACLDMASGDYIALLDHDDFLHPSALFETVKAVCEHGADYVYTDEAAFLDDNIFDVSIRHCKPDFAIDNLRANNYICHFSMFRAGLLEKAGRFRTEYDGSQDFDMILRLTEQAKKVFHVRKILYFWRSHPDSVASDISAKPYAADAAKRAVESHLARCHMKAEVTHTDVFPAIFRIRYALNSRDDFAPAPVDGRSSCSDSSHSDVSSPRISILIPNKDHVDDLLTCVGSILETSTYDNYEILIIENNSTEGETFALYHELEKREKVRVLNYDGAFNYAGLNNFAAKEADGEYLLFLNNDTKVITPAWMEELLMYGQRPDVAAVGAKLYYGDDTVQHAGIVIGLGADRAAGHSHYGFGRGEVGYMGRLCYAQDVSAVTGACMLVKKRIYEALGGMDERLGVAYNDVDFCLKAREKGYLNVFTPFCELYHYESKTRGYEEDAERKRRFGQEAALFKEKWAKLLAEGDPYYSPYFSLDRADFFFERLF